VHVHAALSTFSTLWLAQACWLRQIHQALTSSIAGTTVMGAELAVMDGKQALLVLTRTQLLVYILGTAG
jgi:hypothetical protein